MANPAGYLKKTAESLRREGFSATAKKAASVVSRAASQGLKTSGREPGGGPESIDGLLSALSREERDALVASYLASCGVELPNKVEKAIPRDEVPLDERLEALRSAARAGKRNAAFVFEDKSGDTGTFRYFALNPCEALEDSGVWHGEPFHIGELADIDDAAELIDVLVLVRVRIRPEAVALVERFHAAGRPVAYLVDDDVLGGSRGPRVCQAMGVSRDDASSWNFWVGVCERFRQCALLCDMVIAPHAFAEQVFSRRVPRPSTTIHASVNAEQIRVSTAVSSGALSYKASQHPFTLAYASGTGSHDADFALIEGAVLDFLKRHDDSRLLVVGRLGLSEGMLEAYGRGQLTVLPLVDFATLQAILSTVDVVLAPLVIDTFTNCKSGLKVFEPGLAATLSCASPSAAYQEAIDPGKSGFLCDGRKEWGRCFERLWSRGRLSVDLGLRARELALGHYHGAVQRAEVEHALDSVAAMEARSFAFVGEGFMKRLVREGVDFDDQPTVNVRYGEVFGRYVG